MYLSQNKFTIKKVQFLYWNTFHNSSAQLTLEIFKKLFNPWQPYTRLTHLTFIYCFPQILGLSLQKYNIISHHLLSTELVSFHSCDISSYPYIFLGHPEAWQWAKELTDKQMLQSSSTFSKSSFSMVNRWLQVMSFSCACVYVGKARNITLHLPNQNFFSWNRCTCMRLCYLHPSHPVLTYQMGSKTWSDPQFNSGPSKSGTLDPLWSTK